VVREFHQIVEQRRKTLEKQQEKRKPYTYINPGVKWNHIVV
jgi:hypothetical protein